MPGCPIDSLIGTDERGAERDGQRRRTALHAARSACRQGRPRADIGDLIVIFQSAAYGVTASPILFPGHPIPSEILV